MVSQVHTNIQDQSTVLLGPNPPPGSDWIKPGSDPGSLYAFVPQRRQITHYSEKVQTRFGSVLQRCGEVSSICSGRDGRAGSEDQHRRTFSEVLDRNLLNFRNRKWSSSGGFGPSGLTVLKPLLKTLESELCNPTFQLHTTEEFWFWTQLEVPLRPL